MQALKDSNVRLTRELQSCKEDLEEKSQQYEAAESQRQALQKAYSKLEDGFEQVTGEIGDCRGKVQLLTGENTELLRQNGSLSQQAERAKEEKTQFVSELRGLCYAVFNTYDFRDESAAMEAIGAAFNKLRADCDSLREKEAAATKRADELDAEKDDMMRHLKRAVSCMRDHIAAHKAEKQCLQEECACQQSTIVSLRAVNEGLHDANTKFEQIAQTRGEDVARAEEKNKSLEDALAAAKKEITPLEEREKAAALLLEKDTNVAQLETKLKETEEWVAQLEHKNAATADAAELLRESTKGLSSAVAGLVAALNLKRERRENRIDCGSQTEGTHKVDSDMQTEVTGEKVDANMQTENVAKVSCGTEFAEEASANIPSKLAKAQLEMNRLNIALQQLSIEKEALRNNYTGIHSHESLLASKAREAKEHLEASDRASAALKAENEKLKAEVLELRNHMKSLHERLLYQSTTSVMKSNILERMLNAQQEEVDSLKDEIANLKKNADAAPPVHKVVALAEQKLAQVAAEKLAVVTSTPVTNPGEPVASTSKVPSPMSCGTAEDARPSDKALSGLPLKRTLGMDQDRVDHPVATKETAVTPLPPSAQSTTSQPVTKKRKCFTSSSGH